MLLLRSECGEGTRLLLTLSRRRRSRRPRGQADPVHAGRQVADIARRRSASTRRRRCRLLLLALSLSSALVSWVTAERRKVVLRELALTLTAEELRRRHAGW